MSTRTDAGRPAIRCPVKIVDYCDWRQIPITLICPQKGEQTAQAGVKAWLQQLGQDAELDF